MSFVTSNSQTERPAAEIKKKGSPPSTCHMSHVTTHMSNVTIILKLLFLQSAQSIYWRVCLSTGRPRLVFFFTFFLYLSIGLEIRFYMGSPMT